jgi:hypothetical protein
MRTIYTVFILPIVFGFSHPHAQGQPADRISEPVVFSHAAGFYPDAFLLTLSSGDPVASILYTLDGSDPNLQHTDGKTYLYKNQYPENPGDHSGDFLSAAYNSHTYTQPILIVDRTEDPNKLTGISSTFYPNISYYPKNPVIKGTVVKARLVKEGYEPGPITTNTFFISENPFAMPVISLSLDEDLLFDYEKGIYVPGKDFDDWRAANPYEFTDARSATNYLRDLEYPAHLELFDGTPLQRKINQDIGVKTSGNSSLFWPQKSLRLFARNDYGKSNIEYAFFPDLPIDTYKRITLRNSGNDNQKTMFRDAAIHETVKHLNFGTQAYRPSVVFINGEYWGLHNLREHIDKNYLGSHYAINPDNIDLLEGLEEKEGDRKHYLNLINFVNENDLSSQEHYNYVLTQIDIESFTDYEITEIFAANTDWPGVNVMNWRTRTDDYQPDTTPGMDGRWRWLLKDTDFGFGLGARYSHNTLSYATDPSGETYRNVWWSTILLNKLLSNPAYKEKFVNRFSDLLNSTFLPERIVHIIERLQSGIEPEMPRHIMRWNAPRNIGMWRQQIDEMKAFVNERPQYQRQHITDYFLLKGEHEVTVNVTGQQQGYIHINSMDLLSTTEGVSSNPHPWKGIYFEGIPITLRAIAKPGYRFVKWLGAVLPDNEEVKINLANDVSLIAVFVKESDLVSRFNPLNGSENISVKTFFEWIGLAGQVYDIQVSLTPDFENPLLDQGAISGSGFIPAEDLEISTEYFWRIKESASEQWTEPWSFKTGKDLITAVDDISNSISFYPNPTQHNLTIELQDASGIHSLMVTDLMGRIMTTMPVRAHDTIVKLDLSTYPKGMYIVVFGRNNHTFLQKHVIVH